MENINLDKALEYFKQPGFRRLFEGFRKRYVSLGRIGGTVTLNSLKEEERDVLEGFFQIDCHNRKSLTISVGKMEKALSQTKFHWKNFFMHIFQRAWFLKRKEK